MILTEKEAEFLDKLVTCSKCGSRAVEILLEESNKFGVVNVYVKRCLRCGHKEELEEIIWDEEARGRSEA